MSLPPSSLRRSPSILDDLVLVLLLLLTFVVVFILYSSAGGAHVVVAEGEFTNGNGLKYVAIDTTTAVASAKNAMAVLGEVKKDPTPLLVADKEWEMTPTSRLDNGYPNIMFDPEYNAEKPWRLWYDCCVEVKFPHRCSPGHDLVGLLYAESADGITWTKPSLGLVNFQSSTANNIMLLRTHGLGVFKDGNPSEPPERRYKAFGMTYRSEVHGHVAGAIFTSEDGIHWSENGHPVDLKDRNRWDTHQNMLWDSRRNEYVGFTRGNSVLRSRVGGRKLNRTVAGGRKLNRTVARFVSKQWDGPYEDFKVVHVGDAADDQLYEQLVFPYYNIFLALVVSYDFKFKKGTPDDRTRCELAWSPDSIHWHRIMDGRRGTRELIPLGFSGAADAFDCYPANLPIDIPSEDSIRMYYFGGNGPHFGLRNSTLMLARVRRDGFAGMAQRDVSGGPAVLTTYPLPCNGERPSVSIDVEAGGSVTVRVSRAVCHGAECAQSMVSSPLTESATDKLVEFPNLGESIPPGDCSLEFELRRATLYTFGWPKRRS